jgi:hypothetical protein
MDDSNEGYNDKKQHIDLKPLGVECYIPLQKFSYDDISTILEDQANGKYSKITSVIQSKTSLDDEINFFLSNRV